MRPSRKNHRIHGQRWLCRDRSRRSCVMSALAVERRLFSHGDGALCGIDRLQGAEAARVRTRRLGRDARAIGGLGRPGSGAARRDGVSRRRRRSSMTGNSSWRRSCGAELVVNAMNADPVKELQRALRGAHGVLVTAVSPKAFEQALGMLHKRGTMVLGLPPGEFAVPIFDVVANAKTIRGSTVGTRMDLQEAIAFAAEGKVHTVYTKTSLRTSTTFRSHEEGRDRRSRRDEVVGRKLMLRATPPLECISPFVGRDDVG